MDTASVESAPLPGALPAAAPGAWRRWLWRATWLLVVAGAATAGWRAWLQPVPVPVTVTRVAEGLVEQTVTNSKAGTVKAPRRAALSPEAGGRIVDLPVRKGQRVARGALLLRLADDDARAQLALQQRTLEEARAGARQAQAELTLAEQTLARADLLVREGIAPREQLDQAVARRDAARGALDSAQAAIRRAAAAVDLARVTLGRLTLRAPFDAVVAEIVGEVGEWITPSPPGLHLPAVLELIAQGPTYVSVPIDEVDVAPLHTGLEARVMMDAFPGRVFPGRVSRVAPYVVDREEQNRTIEAEVSFTDQSFAAGVPPGTSADVEIVLTARTGVLRVPSYAVLEGDRVLVVRGDRLVSVPVRTGLRNWAYAEITAGLSRGDQVVVSLDRPEIKAGALVTVAGEVEP